MVKVLNRKYILRSPRGGGGEIMVKVLNRKYTLRDFFEGVKSRSSFDALPPLEVLFLLLDFVGCNTTFPRIPGKYNNNKALVSNKNAYKIEADSSDNNANKMTKGKFENTPFPCLKVSHLLKHAVQQ